MRMHLQLLSLKQVNVPAYMPYGNGRKYTFRRPTEGINVPSEGLRKVYQRPFPQGMQVRDALRHQYVVLYTAQTIYVTNRIGTTGLNMGWNLEVEKNIFCSQKIFFHFFSTFFYFFSFKNTIIFTKNLKSEKNILFQFFIHVTVFSKMFPHLI